MKSEPSRKRVTAYARSLESFVLDDPKRLIDLTEMSSRWVFRGLSDESYKLVPSLARDIRTTDQKKVLHYERLMFELFRKRAVPFCPRSDYSKMDIAAVAQHHGMKTRLMDWTTNPLVATYFAVRKKSDVNAVIYACPGEGKTDLEHDDPLRPSDDFWFLPRHVSPRIVAQAGLFSIQRNPFAPFWKKGMRRITIPALMRDRLRRLLHKWELHPESMFPGLDGLSERLNLRLAEIKK